MSLMELGIEHRTLDETLVATVRVVLKTRSELASILEGLAERIPKEIVVGPPFCVFQFVTSIKDGHDAEVGFPVSRPVQAGAIRTRAFPAIEVLSLVHAGPAEKLGQSYKTLFGAAAERGLITDEFALEVYPDWQDPGGGRVEIQLVLHDWSGLLERNLGRVLGEAVCHELMVEGGGPGIDAAAGDRFRWVRGVMERLGTLASEHQRYDAVSGCAHVFPRAQIDKLKAVYEDARGKVNGPLDAVDAVIDFMDRDPGWGERPRREGRVIYSSKAPRDPDGHAKAKGDMERRRAYCFCPIVRNNMDQGMPITFCYCGAGWYRQQWEGATGKPVEIDVVTSVLKGDDVCTFAIRLSPDL